MNICSLVKGNLIMKEKTSFLVYFDWEEPFECLSNESLGELFKAMIKYAKNQTEPHFSDPTLSIIFAFVKGAIDRDKIAYAERCKKNAENAKKGASTKANTLAETPYPPHDFNSLLKTIS